MNLGLAVIPPNTPRCLSFTHTLFPISNPTTPGRRNLVVLSQSRNLDYYNSDRLVISEPMETKAVSPEVNRSLYADIEPYDTGFLKVSDSHTLYYEQSGNPDGHEDNILVNFFEPIEILLKEMARARHTNFADHSNLHSFNCYPMLNQWLKSEKTYVVALKPVVFLHGGPGGGTSSMNRKFFDPHFYRIILFDQRGAGKSAPHACLEENTTWKLIEDIEKLRTHLQVPEWLVFGGSWGSTLSLAYSESHPDKVTGLVLRGIFLLRKKEIDWFYEGGAAAIYPDAWEPFRDLIPESERGCFVDAYHKRLNSNDKETQYAAARAWTKWEMMTAHLLPNEATAKRGDDDEFCLAFARIENHYFVNRGFFPSDSYLLDNLEKIKHINTVIVQGRYDVCCPMMSAWDLHKAWPEADFRVVPDAGHSANEPGISKELVAATEKLKFIIKGAAP